ncbi:TPA: hypothetical protein ACH3X1_004108 [Trebouxia sp. C0004]
MQVVAAPPHRLEQHGHHDSKVTYHTDPRPASSSRINYKRTASQALDMVTYHTDPRPASSSRINYKRTASQALDMVELKTSIWTPHYGGKA